MKPFHYNQDPLYSAAVSILEGAKAAPETQDETLQEAVDFFRLNRLILLGLVDESEMLNLSKAVKLLDAGKQLSQSQKDLVAAAFLKLVTVATRDASVFLKVKQGLEGTADEMDTASTTSASNQLHGIKPQGKLVGSHQWQSNY